MSESGFAISAGNVTATGPSGVAPVGTEVTLTEIAPPAELSELGITGFPVLNIELAGDIQPAEPVAISWSIPAGVRPDAIAFIASDGPGQPWRGLPVTVTGNRAEVKIEHFTTIGFVDGVNLFTAVFDAVEGFLGQRYAKPEPCAQTVSIDGADVSVESSRTDYVHACLAADNDKVVVTAASNSPYVFPVRVQDYGRVRSPGRANTAESVLTSQVARAMYGNEYAGYLLQGGRVEIEYAARDLIEKPGGVAVAKGRFDQSLALVGLAVTGAKLWIGPGSGLEQVAGSVAVAECFGTVLEARETASAAEVGALLPRLMDCLAIGAEALGLGGAGKLSAAVAILGSLAGYLINPFRALGDLLSGSDFVLTVTSKPGQVTDLTAYRLDIRGLGPFRIGMPADQLISNKWATKQHFCFVSAPGIERQGVRFVHNMSDGRPAGSSLGGVLVWDASQIQTASGARIGMTVGQLKQIYRSKLQIDVKDDQTGPLEYLIVRAGEGEIIFSVSGSVRSDSSVVHAMLARKYSKIIYDGC